jgi:hypothetical protein
VRRALGLSVYRRVHIPLSRTPLFAHQRTVQLAVCWDQVVARCRARIGRVGSPRRRSKGTRNRFLEKVDGLNCTGRGYIGSESPVVGVLSRFRSHWV